MRRKRALAASLLALLVFSAGCAGTKKTATISIINDFFSSMEYVPDEELERMPEPVPAAYTVKAGDSVEGLKIVSVSNAEVQLETPGEYFDGQNYAAVFTVRRGETIRITEVGLMDASHTYTVSYPEDRGAANG